MKMLQSQLDYINKRNYNYNQKYIMFQYLLQKLTFDRSIKVLELFAGIGIESNIINKNYIIDNMTSLELDYETFKVLEKNKLDNQTVINSNCFEYVDSINYNLLLCDCNSFCKKNYLQILNLIDRFNFEYCILTFTGIYHLKFKKTKSKEEYFCELKDILHSYNYYIKNAIYCDEFGLMIITKQKVKSEIIEILKVFSKEEIKSYNIWKNYLTNKNKKLFKIKGEKK